MPLRGIPEEIWPEARRLLERWQAANPGQATPSMTVVDDRIVVALSDGTTQPEWEDIAASLNALLGVPTGERFCQRCNVLDNLVPDPGIDGFFFCEDCWEEREKVSAAHEAGYDNDILEE